MVTSAHEFLLVGGGAAGLSAAVPAAEVSPKRRIAVASKIYPMRCGDSGVHDLARG